MSHHTHPPEVVRVHDLVTPPTKDIFKAARFVKEGPLEWANAKGAKEPKNVYMFLMNNFVLLTERADASSKYKILYFINIKADLRQPDDEDPEHFNLNSPKKQFRFKCSSEAERHEWERAFRYTFEGMPLPVFSDGLWDPAAHLDDHHRQILNEFRTEVQQFIAANSFVEPVVAFANDDATLLRFLRARQFTLKKSVEMIQNTLRWRQEYRPDLIELPEIEREAISGKMYISPFPDRLGRPLVVYRTAIDDTPHDATRVRYMVWQLEELARRGDWKRTAVERSVWLVDFDGAEFNNSKLKGQMNVSIEIIKIMQAHYPETLGKCFLIEAPFLFKTIWAAVTPFIDPVTQRKVNFITKKEAIAEKMMLELFDAEKLESWIGGTYVHEWDYERWKAGLLPTSFPSLVSASSSSSSSSSSNSEPPAATDAAPPAADA